MGEELVPPSPSHNQEETLGRLEERMVSEEEFDRDQVPSPSTPKESGAITRAIETSGDDCIILSPLLKGETASFFSPDLSSALRLLAAKYNSLAKKHQEESCKLGAECDTLRSKCAKECAKRKRLHNELIEIKGNIRVFCRSRPLSQDEVSKGHVSILDEDALQEMELQIICPDNSKKRFNFDHVFGPPASQDDVFGETVPVVRSVLDGYNVCIFAYGQTGSGKTFTMEGTAQDRGVNYKALEELFHNSRERASLNDYDFCISMLEVYNEKIIDLLADSSDQPARRLEIKQGSDGSQDVPGLVEAEVKSVDEVWKLLKAGGRNRSVGSTNANEQSSRSHCLVRVSVRCENLVNEQRSRSHMWLVDLAGSERVGKIEAEGERLKESQHINKSLSALGDVISALASKNPHIPYRNSKLTHLLQSSLGGDCKTLMFAQISPCSADLGETICTLNFASRVRGVQHGPARRQADPEESFKIKQLTEKLRQEEKEVARLNESVHLFNIKYAARENVFKTLQEKIRETEQTCRNYEHKIKALESQIANDKGSRVQHQMREGARPPPHKPPLAPVKQRPPLAGITNRMPPPPPLGSRRNSIATHGSAVPKENAKTSAVTMFPIKARRISLAAPRAMPVSIPVQRRRRASIAILPTKPNNLQHQPGEAGGNSSLSSLSQMKYELQRRRNSAFAASWNNYMQPLLPVASATPDSKMFAVSGSRKYSSPVQEETTAVWRSRIPTVVASPMRRLHRRIFLSPMAGSGSGGRRGRGTEMSGSKLCFNVQRRVVVASPTTQRLNRTSLLPPAGTLPLPPPPIASQEVLGVGIAQRVLVKKNRRNSSFM